jgi:two-component system sensor histidine kinase PilS (NtrC family)
LTRPGWFLPLRLATYVVIAMVVVVWMGYPGYLHLPLLLYSFLTLAFAAAVAFERRLGFSSLTGGIIALHFASEIALEAGVIYATGNIHSSFSALFLLTIVSASLAYRLVGTLLTASTVSIAYSFIIWLGLGRSDSDLNLSAFKTILAADEPVFYSIFVHILIFYLVAFISGYLAEKLRAQDVRLADTSRALRRARLETDDILRHLNSGVLTVDAEGTLIYFNRAAERILGYREEEVRGMSCREVFAERMPQLAESLLRCLQQVSDQPRREIEITNGERERVPLGLSTSLLTEDHREPRGVIAIFSDLTEAKEMESKIRAADRLAAVGELSASIAHEIRNPLAAISGSVEILTSELSFHGENARLMELILKESQRLNNILTEFLTYARIGRPSYNKVELCHIVGEVVELVRHHRDLHPATTISLDTFDPCIYVIGDEGLIQQLLTNLAFNACEALDSNPGTITFRIAVNPDEGTIELWLEDDGPGMPEDLRERIFEPFFSTKKEGTGLGLAIVHRVCSILKLNLAVTSRPEGGTAFTVIFQPYSPEGVSRIVREDAPALKSVSS